MSTAALDDEDVHVKELNRLFLSCAHNGQTSLDAFGLHALCDKLNLLPFADEVIRRVLSGYHHVDFTVFKDRFIQLLPEIIDVNNATDCSLRNVQKTMLDLGIDPHKRFSRYEARLICENTPELSRLSVIDINSCFERADVEKQDGVTIDQFLNQYKLQKRLSQEVNFITETFVPAVNLFEAIDPSNSGKIDSRKLLEHWTRCGLSLDQSLTVLNRTGLPLEGNINAISLSGLLEQRLSDIAASPSACVVVRAALLSLHSFIDHLRCMVKEGESRTEHLQKQLQLANQRRTLLIEELEQNQQSIEKSYEQRMRESEERYRSRLGQMEERFRIEKRELMTELEQVEEELSRTRQSESSTRNRLQMMERQCARMGDEVREMSENVQHLEQLNCQLRSEVNKTLPTRTMEDSTAILRWRHRVELLVSHNKRLRDTIDELKNSRKKRSISTKTVPLYSHWTNAFRSQLLALRRRRQARGSVSEMDSEPESIFVRARKHRLLKVRERKLRYERLMRGRLKYGSSNESSDRIKSNSDRLDQLKFSERESSLEKIRDEELLRIKELHRKEIAALRTSNSKALADALNNQQRQITQNFERERRQFEVRLVTERNAMERKFAEEKMKLISRLQEEFDLEVSRLKSAISSASDDSRHIKNQAKVSVSFSDGHQGECENKLVELKAKSPHEPSYLRFRTSDTPCAFIELMEKCRTNGSFSLLHSHSVTDGNAVAMQKQSSPQTSFPEQKNDCGTNVDVFGRCSRCELVEYQLRQLHSAIFGDGSVIESGIEDVGSSADSILDDKAQLKSEYRRLKNRLDVAKEKVTELWLSLSVQRHSQNVQYRCVLGGSENSDIRKANKLQERCPSRTKSDIYNSRSDLLLKVDRLETEKMFLSARLIESKQLIKEIVTKYKDQLDETSRLGKLIGRIYCSTTDRCCISFEG